MKFNTALKNRNFTDMIVVHCADTPAGMDIGADEIHEWHLERGWSGIGYHFVIRLNGQIELGRPLQTIGAHVANFNGRSIGVCMVGGKGGYTFTKDQEQSLIELLKVLKKIYAHSKVCGHRDLDPRKACPSFDIREFFKKHGVVL